MKDSSKSDYAPFGYIPSLDSLRAIAVLLVICYHARKLYPRLDDHFYAGFLGVDVFFVLSGFLITSVLLQEFGKNGTLSFKNFYMRRVLRLLPAYWLHLVVMFFFAERVFSTRVAEQLYSNSNFLYAFLYLTNFHRIWHGSSVAGILGHTWSLAIEEQFYLLWFPVLFLFLRYFKANWMLVVTGFVICSAAFLKSYRYIGHESVNYLYNSFESRADSLLIGCFVGMLLSRKILPDSFLASRYLDLIGWCSLIVTLAILYFAENYHSPFLYRWGFFVFSLGIGIIIIWLANRKKAYFIKHVFEHRSIVWTGKISYGLYLWHLAAIYYVNGIIVSGSAKFVLVLLLTFAMASASYYLLERPFLSLKRRFQ